MKKIILLAAFGVAGLVSAKGSAETKTSETKKATVAYELCGVTVTFYNDRGEITGQRMYTSDQPNLNSCMVYQSGIIAGLRAQGYNVKTMNTDLN